MFRIHILPAVTLLTLSVLAGCADKPTTGSSGGSVVVGSQGREVSVGDEMHRQIIEEGANYDDPALQAYVNDVGQRLVRNSDMPNETFTFTVIDLSLIHI